MEIFNLPKSDDIYHQLIAAYNEPWRHYHNLKHLENCLQYLDQIIALLKSPEEVELAIWFHDVIYQPSSNQNELHSANWLQKFLKTNGISPQKIKRIYDQIMATQTHPLVTDPDAKFMLDIDLAILGSSPETFSQFETNIRQEYEWVPWQVYCQKRLEILQDFLGRTTPQTSPNTALYQTPYFRERYEMQARDNLTQAIAKLQQDLELHP